MIPEIGQFALALSLSLSLVQFIFPLWGSFNHTPNWMYLARPVAWGQFVFLTLAFMCLIWAFLNNDFSVRYVAQNANTQLPIIYKISAVWGAHEGSMLLWVLLLSAWSALSATFSRQLPIQFVARLLAVLGFVSLGFLLFILFTSNPFERLLPVPEEGRDLNPLLQDLGLALHPPLLYIGYVGLSVAWGTTIAAMLGGQLDATWARWSRPWTLIAWIFLTLGITLGSWWAYYELGWGGWWFWDPVENASLMPWLIATALLHSFAVTEKRAAFKNWTVLLALCAFSLSLLGTFLVRSGVLTSVHAFATDPTRGTFILIFLSLVIGGSLSLYAYIAPTIPIGGRFDLLSRETFLLGNNLLMAMLALFILFGTLAPLIYEAMQWGKISVGFPWFNTMFIALTPILLIMMGIGPLVRWKFSHPIELIHRTRLIAAISLTIGALIWIMAPFYVALGLTLAIWLTLSHLTILKLRYQTYTLITALIDLLHHNRAMLGMWLAHLGVAITAIGITIVSHYSLEQDIHITPNASYELAGYQFLFEGVSDYTGPNYQAQRGQFKILIQGKEIAIINPEKRTYKEGSRPMTEAAIDAALTRDLYISLGEPVGTKGAWSVRIHYKPYVRWIWLGGLLMAIGGIFAVTDRRYYSRVAVIRT